jgi:hypothetical protein
MTFVAATIDYTMDAGIGSFILTGIAALFGVTLSLILDTGGYRCHPLQGV